jgi:hypothetical protein
MRGRRASGDGGRDVRFVGCAPAWRPGEAHDGISCLVVMDERGSIIANSFAGSVEQIAGTVEDYARERRGLIVGVDAPLAVPNERGTRKIERILSKAALPAYSASRRMFGGEPYAEDLLAREDRYRVHGLPLPEGEGAVGGGRGGLRCDAQDPLPGARGREGR